MYCPGCGAEISADSKICPRCAQIQLAQANVKFDFGGTAMQLLGWMLLAILASLVVVPLAWVQAATGRWICRNLKFSDGTTAVFRGTGGQIVGWMILYLVVAVGFQLANPRVALEGILYTLLLLLVYLVLMAVIGLKLIGWFVSSVELSSGPPLSFTGSYAGLLGWNLLVAFSVLTIIGWAWAAAAMYRWFARNTQGTGAEFQFHGKGHQILWRTIVLCLASVFIIPIPWMALWFIRWFVQNVSLERKASAAIAA
jgi:uncharacterized membrane protein YjgN (DUF898 family)